DVVKTGMIATPEMMEVVSHAIKSNHDPYVLYPVMVAKSGDHLMDKESRQTIREALVPLSTVIMSNIPAIEELLKVSIRSIENVEIAAKRIVEELGAQSAIVKGGHFAGDAIDILFDGKKIYKFPTERINTKHTHGTGCTYSAVIAAEIAKGKSIYESVAIAKQFITDAIRFSLEIGRGNGPTNHWGYRLQGVPENKT